MAVSSAQVSVGTTAVKITGTDAGDTPGQVVYLAAPAANTVPIFVGPLGVTAATGYPIANGTSFPSNGAGLSLGAGEDLYAIATSAAQTLQVLRLGL